MNAVSCQQNMPDMIAKMPDRQALKLVNVNERLVPQQEY